MPLPTTQATRFRLTSGASGNLLDTTLCMTASSLTTVMVLFLENHQDPDKGSKLSGFQRFAEIQESQVFVEVGRVRPELLSPFGGVDLSFTVQTEDGTEYTARPARRGER